MHERLCLNAATIKTTALDRQIELAQQAGFRQIGLWSKDVDAAIAGGKSLAEIKAHLDCSSLSVAEFCFIGGWHDADEAQLQQVLDESRHIYELARALGCEIVVAVPALKRGLMRGAPERFRQVCRVAADYNMRIAPSSARFEAPDSS